MKAILIESLRILGVFLAVVIGLCCLITLAKAVSIPFEIFWEWMGWQ